MGLIHSRMSASFSIDSIVCTCFDCMLVLILERSLEMAQGTLTPTLPSKAEAILAKETGRVLASKAPTAQPLRLRMLDDPGKGTIKIPASAVRMLVRILEEMARGNAV